MADYRCFLDEVIGCHNSGRGERINFERASLQKLASRRVGSGEDYVVTLTSSGVKRLVAPGNLVSQTRSPAEYALL